MIQLDCAVIYLSIKTTSRVNSELWGIEMFSEQAKHEFGIKRDYIENIRKEKLSFKERLRLKKRGATLRFGNKHMDRKVDRCYPRGPAFLRMVDMLTISQLTSSRLTK